MLQGLQDLGSAYLSFMNPMTLLYGLGGAFVGLIMGILPGLSATLAIALLTTVAVLLAPMVHRVLHMLHLDDEEKAERRKAGSERDE